MKSNEHTHLNGVNIMTNQNCFDLRNKAIDWKWELTIFFSQRIDSIKRKAVKKKHIIWSPTAINAFNEANVLVLVLKNYSNNLILSNPLQIIHLLWIMIIVFINAIYFKYSYSFFFNTREIWWNFLKNAQI